MKKVLAFFLALGLIGGFFGALPCSVLGAAPQAKKAAAPKLREMGGQKVSCDYFELTIPKGWSMPVPIKKMPEGVSALFGIMKGDLAVTLNVMKIDVSAKEMAEQTLANMRKGGLTAGEPTEKDGIWYADITGKAKGLACFGAADGLASACVIVGTEPQRANELLSAIQSSHKGLFPTRLD